MTERRWERLGAASGLVSVSLLLVTLFIIRPLPDDAAGIVAYFADNRTRMQVAALMVTFGAVVFLWFVGHLRHLLQRAEHGAEAFSPLVLIAGLSLATMTIVHILPAAALAALTKRPGEVNTSVVYALYDMHTLSLGAVGLLVALFAGTAGMAMVRKEVVGPWLGWLGILTALIGLVCGVAAFFVTGSAVMRMAYVIGIPFGLWLGVTSLVMLYRPEIDRGRVPEAIFAR